MPPSINSNKLAMILWTSITKNSMMISMNSEQRSRNLKEDSLLWLLKDLMTVILLVADSSFWTHLKDFWTDPLSKMNLRKNISFYLKCTNKTSKLSKLSSSRENCFWIIKKWVKPLFSKTCPPFQEHWLGAMDSENVWTNLYKTSPTLDPPSMKEKNIKMSWNLTNPLIKPLKNINQVKSMNGNRKLNNQVSRNSNFPF